MSRDRVSLKRLLSTLIPEGTRSFFFVYSPQRRALVWSSANSAEVLSIRTPVTGSGDFFLRYVHEGDRFRVLHAIEKASAGAAQLDLLYRWVPKDTVLHLYARGTLLPHRRGPLLVGSIVDVSSMLVNGSFSGIPLPEFLGGIEEEVVLLDSGLRVIFASTRFESEESAEAFEGSRLERKSTVGTSLEGILRSWGPPAQIEALLHRARESLCVQYTHLSEDERFPYLYTALTRSSAHGEEWTRLSRKKRSAASKGAASPRHQSNQHPLFDEMVRYLEYSVAALYGDVSASVYLGDPSGATREKLLRWRDSLGGLLDVTRSLCRNDKESLRDLNASVVSATQKVHQTLGGNERINLSLAPECQSAFLPSALEGVLSVVIADVRAKYTESCLSITTLLGRHRSQRTPLIRIEVKDRKAVSLSLLAEIRERFQPTFLSHGIRSVVAAHGESVRLELLVPERPNGFPAHELSEPSVVIIDDDEVVGSTLAALFHESSFGAVHYTGGNKALDYVARNRSRIRLVLVDALMAEMHGTVCIERLREVQFEGIIGGVTGSHVEEENLLRAGAVFVLLKPVSLEDIQVICERFFGGGPHAIGDSGGVR